VIIDTPCTEEERKRVHEALKKHLSEQDIDLYLHKENGE
jgi:hypothetical protein